jgi:hypothetical protein
MWRFAWYLKNIFCASFQATDTAEKSAIFGKDVFHERRRARRKNEGGWETRIREARQMESAGVMGSC